MPWDFRSGLGDYEIIYEAGMNNGLAVSYVSPLTKNVVSENVRQGHEVIQSMNEGKCKTTEMNVKLASERASKENLVRRNF